MKPKAQQYNQILVLLGCAAASIAFLAPGGQQESDYQNLQVLPPDIERDKLGDIMVANLLGLGLPRRDGEGCLYCHVGDMGRTRDTWDYASDAKAEKRTARRMMAMVASINDGHLAALETRIDSSMRVGCATCHAGRIDPRPLPEVLMATYEESGIEATVERYQHLRERYFGGNAYDFRPRVLARLAGQIAASGAFSDAITLADANLERYPDDGTANSTVFLLQLYEAYAEGGVKAALELAEEISAGDRRSWFSYDTLDSFGWTIFRRGDEAEAVAVFRSNLERFSDEYIPHESLADALIFTGDPLAGGALYESWVERHPDHEIDRRRLRSFRSQNQRR